MKFLILIFLTAMYFCFFLWIKREKVIKKVLMHTKEYVKKGARKRLISNRKGLQEFESNKSPIKYIDSLLIYSGFFRRFPKCNLEMVIVAETCIISGGFIGGLILTKSIIKTILGIVFFLVFEIMLLYVKKAKNLKVTENELIKFLDFVGNYSLTSSDLTSIIGSVSRYMEEPLSSVLNECFYEAQTTGDASMALLAMSQKIESRQFKEIVRNLEIGSRYSADFKGMVRDLKKSTREFMKSKTENRSVILEAAINIVILLTMSVFILVIVENMADVEIIDVLISTIPGRIALAIYGSILFLFSKQLYDIQN